jgi:hypothetical protein
MRERIFFLMLLILSCSTKRTVDVDNKNDILTIDLLSEPVSKVTKLSDIAEDIEYIPLQTTANSLIGPFILKIIMRDNRIYIRNSGLDREILCFDINGKFLLKINNIGRGPEEYSSANDFDVSSDNKILVILSGIDHKLVTYGISDTGLIFQRSVSLNDPAPFRFGMIPGTNNALMAIPPWRGNEPSLSVLLNTNGDTLNIKPNCYQFVKKTSSIASSEMLVYSIENMICFKEEFSDTVFYVDAGDASFEPRLVFNSHGTLATPAMRGGTEIPGRDATRIDYIFETSRYVFYWYLTSESINGIIFDRKTEKKYSLYEINHNDDFKSQIQKNGLKDDLGGGPDFNIEFVHNYFSGGKIFSLAQAIALKEWVTSEEYKNSKVRNPEKKEALKKLAESLNETDNPVLIIVTPKSLDSVSDLSNI